MRRRHGPASPQPSRAAKCSLLGAIDDATGEVLAAVFREQGDAAGYFELLRQILSARGLPRAVYSDRPASSKPRLAPATIADAGDVDEGGAAKIGLVERITVRAGDRGAELLLVETAVSA